MAIYLTEKEKIMDIKAREARAWINGGSAPYQAARHCGFKTVALMQEAIRVLEQHERDEDDKPDTDNVTVHQTEEKQPAPVTAPRFGPVSGADAPAAVSPQPFIPRPKQYEPDNIIRSRTFSIEYFKAQDGHNEQVRIKLIRRPGFITMRREDLPKLANLLNTMADLLEEEEI